ncbi:hypothetical protein HMPREF1022_01511 [Desulfovibrio sp. 6_1_46AFAA]|uniref:hypothetical protein n=1 Tax=Desulfovibrio sp. 6_1_46AFAA TaxID=665942 RepID=UPI00022372C5|nr:hypothetical protein [Desulfovibrio sp. 6_1_46AFAA]EGW51494.1 hypothetical protein HMPREF1022_01511 [Desulfovibrio sp. 6_1_46AFAA]
MSIPKVLVDTCIVSTGHADPACWVQIDTDSQFFSNKLIVYIIKERKNITLDTQIDIQAIGRAARNNEIFLYEYPELVWETWLGYQSWRNNVSPLYAFRDVKWHNIPSPIDRSKFFQSSNWVEGKEVELFMDFLLKTDHIKLHSLMHKLNIFSEFEISCAKNLPIFQGMCSDKVLGRKRARDIYHLWAAECNNLDYFLTDDKKLINAYKNALKDKKINIHCNLVAPKELIEILNISTDGITVPNPGNMFLMNGLEYIP